MNWCINFFQIYWYYQVSSVGSSKKRLVFLYFFLMYIKKIVNNSQTRYYQQWKTAKKKKFVKGSKSFWRRHKKSDNMFANLSEHWDIILNRRNNFVFLRLKIYWNRLASDIIRTSGISLKHETLCHQAFSWKFHFQYFNALICVLTISCFYNYF